MANQEVKDIIEAGTLEIEFKWLDYIQSMYELENKATLENPYLSFIERQDRLTEDKQKFQRLINGHENYIADPTKR